MAYRDIYEAWLNEPSLDEETRSELRAIADNEREIEERFYRELEFGTAGLRGVLGAGTNRMNAYVVRRATQGLADCLLESGLAERGVCVAYDSRRRSDAFARETARVLAANGIPAFLFSTLHSVPQLSFAVRHLGCAAGVVITASHNPKEYNGYKVYWAYGGQVAPEQAGEIYAHIQATPMFGAKTCDYDAAVQDGRIRLVGAEEDEAYYAATAGLLLRPELVRARGKDLPIVYTPLHGSGAVPVMELTRRVGLTNVTIVPGQAAPDGDFPTVSAPNPENPGAFDLAFALAERTGARVCLATDPDADRLGVAVRTADGTWETLSGNAIGCILLEHILSSLAEKKRLPKNGVVIRSIVSTRLADAICAAYGVAVEDVLTGFRFIGEKVDAYQSSGEKAFLFGFEESFGFLAGGLARDKDAVCAALLVCEACIAAAERGMTLSGELERIYQTYGYYGERTKSYELDGKEGLERIALCMRALDEAPPATLAGRTIAARENYRSGERAESGGAIVPILLPRSDMLRWLLKDGSWIVVRPSGTEPKLKLYVGASGKTGAEVNDTLTALFAAADELLTGLLAPGERGEDVILDCQQSLEQIEPTVPRG